VQQTAAEKHLGRATLTGGRLTRGARPSRLNRAGGHRSPAVSQGRFPAATTERPRDPARDEREPAAAASHRLSTHTDHLRRAGSFDTTIAGRADTAPAGMASRGRGDRSASSASTGSVFRRSHQPLRRFRRASSPWRFYPLATRLHLGRGSAAGSYWPIRRVWGPSKSRVGWHGHAARRRSVLSMESPRLRSQSSRPCQRGHRAKRGHVPRRDVSLGWHLGSCPRGTSTARARGARPHRR
jgi:hypothetical protein